MIFFGANDASLPGTTGQHVPLEQYKQNLKEIAAHSNVQAHAGIRLIIVTPPPVEETILEAAGLASGINFVTRTAETTKTYADAARAIGQELGLEVLDLWSVFMKQAGWIEGQPLPGSKDLPSNEVLGSLLFDGM